MLITGIIAITIAAALFGIKRATFARYGRATGEIVELIERPSHTDDRQDIKFTPKIAFVTAAGARIEFMPNGAFFARMQVGDRVALLYEAKNPQHAVIDSFFHRHLTELVLFLLGLAAVLPNLPK